MKIRVWLLVLIAWFRFFILFHDQVHGPCPTITIIMVRQSPLSALKLTRQETRNKMFTFIDDLLDVQDSPYDYPVGCFVAPLS